MFFFQRTCNLCLLSPRLTTLVDAERFEEFTNVSSTPALAYTVDDLIAPPIAGDGHDNC